ncbi:MAG: DUF456 domain-containing protein [Bacteroides sp.]|nr:DUF456 domain-containing protein [Bacteroides sp.]
MDIFLITLGILCLLVGLAGCVLPMLPGPPVAYAALILLELSSKGDFTTYQLCFWLFLVVAIQVMDYFIPMLGTKYSGGSAWGNRGCLAGTLIGLLFLPWGIVLGPFLGAVIGEMLGGRNTHEALKAGFGSLLGFLLGTVAKCVLCSYFIWIFIEALV